MAIGPRLDLRQTQTLVMTPQLRQAIKLLQFSNIEVDRLRRGGAGAQSAAGTRRARRRTAAGERAAARPDRAAERRRWIDAARCARVRHPAHRRRLRRWMPTTPRPTIAGGAGDGAPLVRTAWTAAAAAHRFRAATTAASTTSPATRRPLRDHLGEQLRLIFDDPVDRMIGAHLIALLCPAGRLTADPAGDRDAMDLPLERIEAVRARMMRFDPVGLFARDLKECLAAQLAERNRLDPAMADAAGQPRSAGAARDPAADGAVRRRCRRPGRHDRRDPRAGSQAGGRPTTPRRRSRSCRTC